MSNKEPPPPPSEPTGEPVRAEVEVTPVERPASPVTPEQREAALDEAVSRDVALGYKVESQRPNQVVLVGEGFRVHNGTHLVLTIVTAGLWGIVWLIQYFRGRQRQLVLTVDEAGRVNREASNRPFKG
jgi:hypothetical protein